MDKIDETRLDLVREYRRNPIGKHSPELQKLLKLLRWDPPGARVIAVQKEQGGLWYLARSTGQKGNPVEIYEGPGYADLAEVQWVIFRRRWELHTGKPLDLGGDDGVPDAAREGIAAPDLTSRPILGYADLFSVEAGKEIAFKVSAAAAYNAKVLRLRSGDAAGVGFKADPVEAAIEGDYPGRWQEVACGSYVEVAETEGFALKQATLLAYVWPTRPQLGRWQAIVSGWTEESGRGYLLGLDAAGQLALRLGDSAGGEALVTSGRPLLERHWYLVAAGFDAATGEAWVAQRPLHRYAERSDSRALAVTSGAVAPAAPERLRLAAWAKSVSGEAAPAGAHFNGKIDSPAIAACALGTAEREALLAEARVPDLSAALVARWDFSQEIPTTRVVDSSPAGRHGETVNLPTRAMKGWNWDGSEYNWVHKPEHYGAIHFHDDDLYDCGWETDFVWQVPQDLKSGLYCLHLTSAGGEDYVPFVVRPPRGTRRADLALILPTASYWAYGNTHHHNEWRDGENVRGVFTSLDATALFLHENPQFGCSLYDHHSDGSGVCYASRLRPLLNMRPKERLWQLPADTHIIDWLEQSGLAYDLLTEDDIEAEGASLLEGYRCIMTGTHPEYPSLTMLEAFETFQNGGGRFVYMGGNGFYWRTSYHPTLPGVIEMRRGEDGIRTWLAEGGEYYHSFTGELGGMWRRMGWAPQRIAGAGMTAQGFDISTCYHRTEEGRDPRAAFIFEGIGEHEPIGDFGIIGGGAAGWEIDRADVALGTPPHALVVARASDFTSAYHWMKEELTHTHSAITGETCPLVRCDMVFYETPNGGAVFSTSSIAWAGALSHQDYDNNVSRLMGNVLRRFLDPAPF